MGEPVIVVGAGPGGLAAAWRLQRAGHRVRILEEAAKVGGRIQSTHKDGFVIDRAAQIVPDAYTNILGIVAEAGLGDELVKGGSIIGFARPGGIHYLDSDRLYSSAARTRLLSPRSKLMMLRLLRDARRLDPLMSYEDLSVAAGYDTETAAEYAARRVTPEIAEYVIDGAIRAILGTRARDVSVLEFFFSFSKVFGSTLWNFRNGMGSYPEALATRFPDLQLNASVQSVRETADEVEVTWRDAAGADHVERAAGCVVAVPADRVPGLVPGLDEWRRSFLSGVRYTTTVSVNAGLSAPPRDVPGFVVQVPPSVDDDLMCVVMEHHKAPEHVPPGKGGLTTFTMHEAARRLLEKDDDTVIDEVLRHTEGVIGKLPHVEWALVNRWTFVCVRTYPGYYREVGRFQALRRSQDRRVQLAGDFYSSSNANTATAAGEAAARDLLTGLTAGRGLAAVR
jgi:protoporphyrinogen/coproporphyrinogen III oxidase